MFLDPVLATQLVKWVVRERGKEGVQIIIEVTGYVLV